MERIASVSGLKCSDSPLHGNYSGFFQDSGEVGFGLAVLYQNGDMVTYSRAEGAAAVGIGQWWVTGSNSFQFNSTGYSVTGGSASNNGYGTFSEDDLTTTFNGGGELIGIPMQSFQHSLSTAKMAGEYNIYDWDDVYLGTATVQNNGTITGTTKTGCTVNGRCDVPNANFNQAYILDASISGCRNTVYGAGAAVYRNATGEIVIVAADGWTGYVWTLKPK